MPKTPSPIRRADPYLKAIRGVKRDVGKLGEALAAHTLKEEGRFTNIEQRLGQLVDSTEPYVKLRQAVLKGREDAKAVGRFTTATVDWLLRYGKAALLVLAAFVIVRSWAHGDSPREALALIWQIWTR